MDSDPTSQNSDGVNTQMQTRAPASAGRNSRFERQLRFLCLCLAAPSLCVVAFLLWRAHVSGTMAAAVLGGLAFLALIATGLLLEKIVRPLQTLSNVISALRESDYSFRARGAGQMDALGELALEINEFASFLQAQRLMELEATALLRRVISSMDAPVFAFDPENRLRLMNSAAGNIFQLSEGKALGVSAGQLQLDALLDQPDRGIFILLVKGSPVHWMVRRSTFRQRGIPHTLLVLSDVSVALREQERDAWQRLIRVMGHEINNSLTPIKSIAGSLQTLTRRSGKSAEEAADNEGSLQHGLQIIENRADSLNRFVQAYRQLAQLPLPCLKQASLPLLIERAAALETRVPVRIVPGPELWLEIDPDQMEQLLINLVRNAAEACLERFPRSLMEGAQERPEVTVAWHRIPQTVIVRIEDNGVGLSNPSNLFVPFYTTKVGGSGIGLALARQISEAHGGILQLSNRSDALGCIAEIRLPMMPSSRIRASPGEEGATCA